ncbi:hypothetical protein OHS81_34510 [Streptomyces sp. NBC_00400]|uniref:hypothetical protein n=1 Tax=Streptomyces sp. NBC_00400 TaxID=2975737 RepID=UPI002E2431FA
MALADRYHVCQDAAVRLQKAGNEEFLRRLNRGLPQADLILADRAVRHSPVA